MVVLIRVFLFAQQKYFDSGDYNMAKAKMKNKQLPSAPSEKAEITGGHIPTPQDLPQRKTSIVASKLAGWCSSLAVLSSFHCPSYIYLLFTCSLFFTIVHVLQEQCMYKAKYLRTLGSYQEPINPKHLQLKKKSFSRSQRLNSHWFLNIMSHSWNIIFFIFTQNFHF